MIYLALAFHLENGCKNTCFFRESVYLLILSSFLNWNMPYGALGLSKSVPDHPPPFTPISPPSDVSITTPPSDIVSSPKNAPSPLSVALQRKKAFDRAHLFVQGKHDDLILSMNKEEQR
jgi:hypothetical protein